MTSFTSPDGFKAPEGVAFGYCVYIVNKKTGVQFVKEVRGLDRLVLHELPAEPGELIRSLCGSINENPEDWRLMTREEIQEFEDTADDEEDPWT